MAELAKLDNLGFASPQVTTAFNPTWQAPMWRPSDFQSAYQFAPRPISPNAYSASIASLGDNVATALSYQNRLNNALSSGALNAYTAAQAAPAQAAQPLALAAADPSASTAPSGGPDVVSNVSAPDDSGFHMTLGTTFATPSDLADFVKNRSLNTGDNGVGAWGNNTKAGSGPQVALSPSFLRSKGIDPTGAFGTPITLMANGKTLNATVGDKMPDNSANGAGIDLNPDAATGLGIQDVDNFKGPIRFKIGHAQPSEAASQPLTPAATSSIPNAPLFGFLPNVAPAPNLPTIPLPSAQPDGTQAALAVAKEPVVPIGDGTVPRVQFPLPAALQAPQLSARPAQTFVPALPAAMPPQSEFLSRLQAAFGAGHPEISNGNVSYQTSMPLTPLAIQTAQAELGLKGAETAANNARAQHYLALTSGGGAVGKNDTDPAIQRQLAMIGGDPSKFIDGEGNFDRQAALTEIGRLKTKPAPAVADMSNLDDSQKLQAAGLSAEIFGKRIGGTADKITMVANLLRQGMDPVAVRTQLQPSQNTMQVSRMYEHDPAVNIYNTTATNYAGVKRIADIPYDQQTSADQLSLLFAYTNADNPKSAVTQAAFNEAVKAGTGLPAKVQQFVNNVQGGQLLTAQQVQNFEKAAKEKLAGTRQGYLVARDRLGNLAERTAGDAEDALGPDFDPAGLGDTRVASPPPAAAAPSVAPASSATVRMKKPDGTVIRVPAANVQAALALGATTL